MEATTPELIGGHVVLDFANTIAWRLDERRTVDRVSGPAELLTWAGASGLLDADRARALLRVAEADPDGAAHTLRAARRLRTALLHLLDAAVDGLPPRREDLAVVRRCLRDAWDRAEFAAALPLRPELDVTAPDDVVRALALEAAELLSGPLANLRRCRGPGCGWFFLDRSRSHTRQWCRTGDCGNRERVRRHYARSRDTRH
ncbi:putative RNA-binding Zn ribbon-like protein [Streptomyces sp. V3I8]|jgi:predicted RNA-binding Zn ribbon-like protein|uniref:CGNR zinc finger domain-containing protein n=1 Tax=Streptomyces sp. V3I8 TaxID=3042279 RepID=UPI00278817A4|nr:CGNR zinc finger domain-containing protein [Streptomyces sp. V3I8]MDQ1034184.1 putative RNA-binding Zn ribbon-like protein [Streptomyces sp. V3I8]